VTHKPDVPLGEVERFLVSRHGRPIESLAPLPGGFWSAAYAYRVAGQDLVLRLGTIPAGFEADRVAMTFSAPDLPVPKVVAIGHAFGVCYAISERHYGRFLEDVRAEESLRSGPMLGSLLRARCGRSRNAPTAPSPASQQTSLHKTRGATTSSDSWSMTARHGMRAGAPHCARTPSSSASSAPARPASQSCWTPAGSGATSFTAISSTRTCSLAKTRPR